MDNKNFENLKKDVLTSICKTLIQKNLNYGNAALNPNQIFFKGSSSDSILIRLNDKVSRVINSNELRKNDLFDILGYIILYFISKNESSGEFKDDISVVYKDLMSKIQYDNEIWISAFSKCNRYLILIDIVINNLKSCDKNNEQFDLCMYEIIKNIVKYFIDMNITDFNDMID